MTEPSSTDEQAEPTPQIHDPVHRAAHMFEREGENLRVYTWMESGTHFPEHFHPSLEEHITAIDGAVRVKLNGGLARSHAGRWNAHRCAHREA